MACFILGCRHAALVALTACLLARSSFADNASTAEPEPIEVTKRALAIHRNAPVVDGHNDLPWALRGAGQNPATIDLSKPAPQFHTDIERLREGGVGAQFWSVYVPVSTMQRG